MKWIKFFEAFNSVDPVEVCEDIRSIAYELENDGYEINIKLLLDAKEWVTRIDVEQYDKELMTPIAIILEFVSLQSKICQEMDQQYEYQS